MAVTNPAKGARGGISSFIIDKGTPGFNVLRKIPMVGGRTTFEVANITKADKSAPASAALVTAAHKPTGRSAKRR